MYLAAAEHVAVGADFGLAFEQRDRHALTWIPGFQRATARPHLIGQHTSPLFEVQDLAQRMSIYSISNSKTTHGLVGRGCRVWVYFKETVKLT